MKLTTQLAVVICIGALGMGGLVLGLAVWANWSDGAVVGMVTVFGTIMVNLVVAIRNQQKTSETLVAQDRKLDTVVAQTNGLSELERDDIARRAAAAAITLHEEGKRAA